MQLKDKLAVLMRLHYLIEQRATGNSLELADQLNVSKSTLFRYLNELRSFGAPIAFCMEQRHYYYKEGFDLALHNILPLEVQRYTNNQTELGGRQ